jgi:hypothetical protein
VAVTSLGAITVLVILFGLGTLAMSRRDKARTQGGCGSLSAVGMGVAFAACAVIALFGLYLTIVR